MSFTRISDTEAAYVSNRGTHYRLLALTTDGEGEWMVIPDVSPPQPTFYAVPQQDFYGLEIRRGAPDGELVGYSENLSDAAWPVEHDLINRGVDA
jgi:hypothetical protein